MSWKHQNMAGDALFYPAGAQLAFMMKIELLLHI
jgi:hypothetical protein